MDGLRRFGAIVRADFRERSRSTRFWVVLAGVGIATWWLFPPITAGYVTVGVGGWRALYSSAWVGMVLGLVYASILSLFGFYIVRGTLSRDFETRVWQLLVATPMTRPAYLLAKWTSHMAVFALIVAAGLAVGVAAQIHRGESDVFSLWQLVQPTLVFTLPSLALVAFMAVLFDLLPWLRRSGGNVLYFFLWIFVFIALGERFDPEEHAWAVDTWLSDPSGIALAMRDIHETLARSHPQLADGGFSIGVNIIEEGVRTFVWNGWTPAPMDLLGRFLWLAVAVGGLFALAPMLDWAASRSEASQAGQRSTAGFRLAWMDALLRPLEVFAAGRLFAAEAKVVLRQRRLVWWLAVIGLLVAQAFSPPKAQAIQAIVAWLLSMDVFARAALRESETATAALVFSASGAARRILAVRLAFSFALAVGLALPTLLRSLDNPMIVAALLAAAATIAVSGIALATACRNPRPFELAMVAMAYIGVQGDALLNPFVDPAASLARHAWLLPAFVVLLAVAWPLSVRRR